MSVDYLPACPVCGTKVINIANLVLVNFRLQGTKLMFMFQSINLTPSLSLTLSI